MTTGDWLSPGSGAYLLAAKLVSVAVSSGSVVAAAIFGGLRSARCGLFAAFAIAVWPETAFFSTQALTEAVAVPVILLGAALSIDAKARPVPLLTAGGLFALGAVLRFQYAPAIAVLGAVSCGLDRKRWCLAIAGGCAVFVAAGMLDAAMGQRPFGWIVENIHQNITLKRSYAWTDGPSFYPLAIVASSGPAFVPLVMLAWRVAPRYPGLVACAIVNIAAHTLIAHKEYRYILLSTTILALLAAIGTIDLVDGTEKIAGPRRTGFAVAIWAILAALFTTTGTERGAWNSITPRRQAFSALRTAPGLCGLAIVGADWAFTGGYAYLHRSVPLYVPDDYRTPPESWVPRSAPAFDTIMAPASLASALPSSYRATSCFGNGTACLYRRPGHCDPRAAPSFEINRVLVRTDR